MAQVFSHVDGTVYKFWVKDDSYEKYIEYCLDNQQNPHIPILYSPIKTLHSFFTRPKHFPDTIRYVKMEQLKPVKNGTRWKGIKDENGNTLSVEEVFEELENCNSEKQFEKDFLKYYHFSTAAKKEVTDVFTIIQDLKKIKGVKKMRLDLHMGNVMLRGNTVVIVDPLVNNKTIGFNNDLEYRLDLLKDEPKNERYLKRKVGPSSTKKETK